MKFSIITVVYNNADTIEDAIKSVLSQDYSAIEYIIIDGNSKDGTKSIIKDYASEIDVFISEPDKGLYDALNKGIEHASGDVIGFLHSDDVFENAKVISNIARTFSAYNTDGVYGDLLYVNKENTDTVVRNWKSKAYKQSNLKWGWMPAHPTLYLKRSLYVKYGNFDLSFKVAADYDFMLRILSDKSVQIKYLPKVFIRMRLGGESNKSLRNIIQKMKDDLHALRRNKVGGYFTLFCKNIRKLPQFI